MFPLGLTGSPQYINRVVSLTEFSSSSDTGPDSSRIQVHDNNACFMYILHINLLVSSVNNIISSVVRVANWLVAITL